MGPDDESVVYISKPEYVCMLVLHDDNFLVNPNWCADALLHPPDWYQTAVKHSLVGVGPAFQLTVCLDCVPELI